MAVSSRSAGVVVHCSATVDDGFAQTHPQTVRVSSDRRFVHIYGDGDEREQF